MNQDQTFRFFLIVGALIVLPVMVYHRLRSQATREKLDRWQEGLFILFALRPLGFATVLGLIAYMIDPHWMAWSSISLPAWLRWVGVGLGVIAGGLLIWTLRNLGKNLTDTVVTRRAHTLVISGPYRWVRHPFYDAVALSILANAIAAANWFPLLTGSWLWCSWSFERERRKRSCSYALGIRIERTWCARGAFCRRCRHDTRHQVC